MKKRIKRNSNRWILTKERLPKVCKWYLVLSIDGYVTTDLFIENNFMGEGVVAWMEIPKPPVKGEFEY